MTFMPKILCTLVLCPAVLLAFGRPAEAQSTFLTLSDVHYGIAAEEHVWGHSHETSKALWDKAQTKARALRDSESAAFTLYLGDMPAHNQADAARKLEFTTVLTGLATIAGDSHRLYFLPGNNDSLDRDYCAFDSGGQVPFVADDKYDPTKSGPPTNQWPTLRAGDTLIDASHIDHGYYSAYPLLPDTGLRLIALNTVMFTDDYGTGFNWDACENALTIAEIETRIATQLQWLATQLTQAEAAGEKVILAMHVPPGIDGYGGGPMWTVARGYSDSGYTGDDPLFTAASAAGDYTIERVFLALTARHAKTISAMLTAHTHLDDLRLLTSCQGDAAGIAYGVPGITTDHGNNPAMKVFGLDATFALDRATTYYATEFTAPKFDWHSDTHYGFTATYCPTGRDCSGHPLSSVLQAWNGDTQGIAKRMLTILRTGRGAVSGHYYAAALDAAPNCTMPRTMR